MRALECLAQPKTLVVVGLLVLFWTWEALRPFREFPENRWRHGLRNLSLTIGNTLLLTLALGSVTALVAGWTSTEEFGLLHVLGLGQPWRVLLALLMLDLWMYLWHRANHALPLLWRFHRMHHSDAALDVTSATRFHLGELVLSGLLRLALIPALGLSLGEILFYDTIALGCTQFHHSNISLGRWDRLLRWLIVTPAMHQLHHSRWKPETDSNFSVILSVWDRIAHSFRLRSDASSVLIGLDEFDEPRWQTLAGMLAIPFAPKPKPEQALATASHPSEPEPLGASGCENRNEAQQTSVAFTSSA